MGIANIICISKEKSYKYYVDLIVQVFEENPKTFPRRRVEDRVPIKDVQGGVVRPKFDGCG